MSDINVYRLVNLTLSDPFTETWMKLYGYMLKKNYALIQNFPQMNKKEFSKISDYEQVYHFFLQQQQKDEMVNMAILYLSTVSKLYARAFPLRIEAAITT